MSILKSPMNAGLTREPFNAQFAVLGGSVLARAFV
jgi:hypothetical protein